MLDGGSLSQAQGCVVFDHRFGGSADDGWQLGCDGEPIDFGVEDGSCTTS
jgi:hypothetical protein